MAKAIAAKVARHSNARRKPDCSAIEKQLLWMLGGETITRADLASAVEWGVENYQDRFCRKIHSIDGVVSAVQSWAGMIQREKPASKDSHSDGVIKRVAEAVRKKKESEKQAEEARRRTIQAEAAKNRRPKNCVDMPIDPDLL